MEVQSIYLSYILSYSPYYFLYVEEYEVILLRNQYLKSTPVKNFVWALMWQWNYVAEYTRSEIFGGQKHKGSMSKEFFTYFRKYFCYGQMYVHIYTIIMNDGPCLNNIRLSSPDTKHIKPLNCNASMWILWFKNNLADYQNIYYEFSSEKSYAININERGSRSLGVART